MTLRSAPPKSQVPLHPSTSSPSGEPPPSATCSGQLATSARQSAGEPCDDPAMLLDPRRSLPAPIRRAALAVASLFALTAGAAEPVTVLRAARLYDGKAEAMVTPGIVVVSDGQIVAAGSAATVPSGARVLDLGDATLLPGLIDAHTHLSSESSLDWKQDQLDRRSGRRSTRGGRCSPASPRCATWARAISST